MRRSSTPWSVTLRAALALGLLAGCADSPGTDRPAAEKSPVSQAPTDQSARDGAETAAEPSEESLLSAPADEYSEVGQLVEGFPIELLPVPADSVILVTSAVPVGEADVQEVSLNLRTSATPDEILALYRDALGAAGFTEAPPAQAQTDLAAETTFTRSSGDELVSIGVLDVDGARTVTIGGRVRAAQP